MEMFILDIEKMIKQMDEENIYIWMEPDIQEIEKMINNMDKEKKYGLMVLNM